MRELFPNLPDDVQERELKNTYVTSVDINDKAERDNLASSIPIKIYLMDGKTQPCKSPNNKNKREVPFNKGDCKYYFDKERHDRNRLPATTTPCNPHDCVERPRCAIYFPENYRCPNANHVCCSYMCNFFLLLFDKISR